VIQNRRAQPTPAWTFSNSVRPRTTARKFIRTLLQLHLFGLCRGAAQPESHHDSANAATIAPINPCISCPFPLRLMYAFGLCISPQILRVAHLQRLFLNPVPYSLFPVLYTPTPAR